MNATKSSEQFAPIVSESAFFWPSNAFLKSRVITLKSISPSHEKVDDVQGSDRYKSRGCKLHGQIPPAVHRPLAWLHGRSDKQAIIHRLITFLLKRSWHTHINSVKNYKIWGDITNLPFLFKKESNRGTFAQSKMGGAWDRIFFARLTFLTPPFRPPSFSPQ